MNAQANGNSKVDMKLRLAQCPITRHSKNIVCMCAFVCVEGPPQMALKSPIPLSYLHEGYGPNSTSLFNFGQVLEKGLQQLEVLWE